MHHLLEGDQYMNMKQLKSSLLLLLTAVIWGVAFVAQSTGMDHVGPFTFNAARSVIGGLVLLPVIFAMDRKKSAEEKINEKGEKYIHLELNKDSLLLSDK